jgi:fibronectin-binding autotransporter adhesin
MTLRTPLKICVALALATPLLIAAHANAQSVWDGGGVDNNFKTAANWVGDVVPTPGSILTFDGSSRFAPNNDFVAGTAFSGISFASTAAGPFTITGSSINLTGNITDSTQSFTQTISLPLALQVTPTINVASFGSLTMGGVISGAFGLNETGNGLLTLSGVNTFTGPISVGSGATLSVATDTNLGAVPGAFSASAISLAGGATFRNSANLTLNVNRGVSLGAGVSTLDTPTGTTLTYNGVMSGAGGFSKLSFGNISLGGANTYTGPTNIKTGTLTLDFTQATAPASNIISSSSALTLGGANAGLGNTSNARLTLTGKASTASSQTFNGTTIDVGPAVIQATSGAGGSATLNLGAISANKGGVANFILPTSGNIKTTSSNVNGILGGWATVGTGVAQNNVIQGTDWATVDGGGNIVAYTGYAAWASGTAASNSFTAATNAQVTNGASVAIAPDNTGTIDINSLALKNTVADQAISVGVGNTLRFGAVGGIIRQDTGSNVTMYVGETGAGQHNQGIITAGGAPNTPGTLVLTVNANSESAGALRLGAILADNGTGKLTFVKAGPGNLKIDGLNTYTGDSYILQGRVQMTGAENGGVVNPNAFGTGTVYVFPGAYIFPGNFAMTNNLVLAGIGTNQEPIGALRFGNGNAINGSVTLSGDARVGGGNGGATGITGKISGPFNFDLGAGASVASNFTISNPLNDWTGNTTIVARTGGTAGNTIVHLGADEVIPNGIGKGNLIFGITGTTASTMTLDLNGHNETVNGVTVGTGATATLAFIQNNSATAASITLGDNNQTATFNGTIQNGTGTVSLTKIGTGVQTLGSVNTYSGNTTINNGALSIGGLGSLSSSGNVIINTSANSAGALFGGSGANAGSVGNVTLAPATGPNKAVINPGITGAGSNGILNVASLTVGAGSNLQFDLGNTTPGNFDQIVSAGPVTFNGASTITPSSLAAGSYTIMTGTFSGTAPTLVSGGDTRLTYAFDAASWTNNPGNSSIIVNVSGSVANLTWTGATTNTWDLHTTQNWTSAALVNPNLFFNGDNVLFNDTGANREIAIGGAIAPGNMTFTNSAGDYSVTGGGSIGGVGTLTKSGTSALTIGTANTFSGNVTLGAGQLNINNSAALGSSPTLIINGGSLGNTSGAAVTVASNPAQTWRTDIAFNGTSDLNLGTGAVTQDPANLTSGAARTFTINNATLTVGGNISNGAGNNGIVKAGTGTLALGGQNAFSGATAINAGTLRIGTSTSLGGAQVINASVFGGTTITLPSVAGLFVGGSVTGTGIAAGTTITAIDVPNNVITLSATSTSSPNPVDLTFGTSTAAVTVASGAALDFGGTTTANSIVVGPREVSIIGDGVSGSGALTNSGTTNQQNALQVVTLTGNASVGGTGRFDIRAGQVAGVNTAQLNLAGFTLTKNGTNQFTVVSANVNQGNIVVNAGTFAIEAGSNVLNNNDGTSITVNSGATLQFFANTGTVSRPIILNGTGITVNDNTGANPVTPPTIASNFTVGGDVTINGANATSNLVLTGKLTETGGSRSITKTGPGKLTLANTLNEFSGQLNLNGGLVNFAAVGSLGTATPLNFDGGGLQYGTGVTADLSSTRTMTFNAGGGTIDTNSNDVTFAGNIGNNGTGGFTKAGAGTLTLNGASNYSGVTTVGGGTLVLGGANSFPTNGGLTVGDGVLDVKGKSLTVSSLNSVANSTQGQIGSSTGTNVSMNYAGGSNTSTFSGSLLDSVNGGFGQTMSLNVNSGTLILSGSSFYTGATTVASGATLQIGSGGTNNGAVGPASITNNGTLRFNSSSIFFPNTISGSGSVVQVGGSTTLPAAANTYTGGTRLEGGILAIGSDAAINNGTGGITFAGGTLQLENYTSNLSLNGNNVRVAGNSAVLTGPISGTGTTTFSGSSLKVTAASTYTGNTTISGVLELGGNGRLPAGTNLTMSANLNAALNTGGFSQNFGTLAIGGAFNIATIDQGAGASVLHFANSSTTSWGSNSLQILNWSGSSLGGGTDQLFVGSNGFSGLTHDQLNHIQFGVGVGALLLSTGELVPNMGATLPLPVRGDLNGDTVVNGADLPVLLQALTNLASYETTHQLSDGDFLATVDVDNSGAVNNRDIQALIGLIGNGSLAPVPEPGTMVLMGVGALGLLAVRRKNCRG